MGTNFELAAKTLVDQHYAAGPDQMKQVLAQALKEAATPPEPVGDPRKRLEREVAELEKASERGSE
ncbi:hypothetical protein O9Z70_11000 [Devosia sp. YIM 151766]|uniref:hypothetical protein n=1 Tax=Devosia sp. YIM 151766 TaxID=3017325 RepID=UPI00255CB7CD|nr:hypothetical protein [Devosia sp. YIM 151766]WIY52007.1 hypothetical protein O9Z70_11000 [Devosia sp. YIM 151766]